MGKHQPIWYMGQIPTDVCDLATAEYMQIEPRDATMGIDGTVLSHPNRNTTIRFAQPDHWFGNMMRGFGLKGNKECGWDFDITEHEAVQLAHYGVGQHYDWHVDCAVPEEGLQRKLSFTLQLSDPDSYEGGDLLIGREAAKAVTRKQGSIVVFPSCVFHKVTPVTQGERFSAVSWMRGPQFR
jgi:PKHD-type hydroxylase